MAYCLQRCPPQSSEKLCACSRIADAHYARRRTPIIHTVFYRFVDLKIGCDSSSCSDSGYCYSCTTSIM